MQRKRPLLRQGEFEMGTSVRLTAEQDVEKQYLIEGTDLSHFVDFRFGNRARAMRRGQSGKWDWKFSAEFSSRAAQALRRSENLLWRSARAFDSSGQLIGGEPPVLSTDPVHVDITYQTAQASDGTYRQIPAIRKVPAGYCIDFNVWLASQWRNGTIQGRTPNEAIEKLFQAGNPIYEAFILTLPIVDEPVATSPAAVDLSSVAPMTEKEYASIPSADVNRQYLSDPVFKQRVDLLLRKRRANEAARKAAAQDDL
jgi:hypothetical protein